MLSSCFDLLLSLKLVYCSVMECDLPLYEPGAAKRHRFA